jgi:GNAT superfamily N-acetyltransferase
MPDSSYEIRSYEPADRDAVLDLYGTTFGPRSEAWFEWRYVDNPFLPEVPIVVAEHDGDVVGARPSLPFPLRVGDDTALAVLQVDPMVHPDHRRQGLFTRMVSEVYDRYADREPTVSIGFPDEPVKDALERLGDELSLHAGVGVPFPEYYRVQDPDAMARSATDDAVPQALARLSTPVARGYLAVRDSLGSRETDIAVESVDGVPAGRLADLALGGQPRAAHARRTEEFYRWRFANPRFEDRTYLASRDGEPTAAMVLSRLTDPAIDTDGATVAEVVPLEGDADRDEAVAALLDRAVADAADADLLAATGSGVPAELLADRGFHADTAFPLSGLSTTNYLIARPLTDDDVSEWTVGGRRLASPDNWRFTYCERALG